MNHVFDMDGTLVDTRRAVVHAYRIAGIDMPPGAWGQPWREWCDPKIHELKVRAYPAMLRLHAQPLDCLAALKVIARSDVPLVLTGASLEAVTEIVQLYQIPRNVEFKTGLSREHKVQILSKLRPGVYVDDDTQARIMVRSWTKWQPMSPEVYLRSFWQLGPTHG